MSVNSEFGDVTPSSTANMPRHMWITSVKTPSVLLSQDPQCTAEEMSLPQTIANVIAALTSILSAWTLGGTSFSAGTDQQTHHSTEESARPDDDSSHSARSKAESGNVRAGEASIVSPSVSEPLERVTVEPPVSVPAQQYISELAQQVAQSPILVTANQPMDVPVVKGNAATKEDNEDIPPEEALPALPKDEDEDDPDVRNRKDDVYKS